MQVESNNNYNTLGRMGPLYPRPEYRPRPNFDPSAEQSSGGGQDKVNVSANSKNKAKNQSQPQTQTLKAVQSSAVPEGRLNLLNAKKLTEETALAISQLNPSGHNQSPHSVTGLGLMAPCYV
jgi:hypothetical protein